MEEFEEHAFRSYQHDNNNNDGDDELLEFSSSEEQPNPPHKEDSIFEISSDEDNPSDGFNNPNKPLNLKTLAKQKEIFERCLVNEILKEIEHASDVVQGRSIYRKDFNEKVFKLATTIGKKLLSAGNSATRLWCPPASISMALLSLGVEIVEMGVDNYSENKAKRKLMPLCSLFYQICTGEKFGGLEAYLHHFAQSASLRYEHLIATRLTVDPAGSVIPLAHVGARRVVEYLQRIASELGSDKTAEDLFKEFESEAVDIDQTTNDDAVNTDQTHPADQQRNLNQIMNDYLLTGLIEGRTGKKEDAFKNNHLVGRGHYENKVLTVEGAFGRSAMRELEGSDIYYRKESLLVELSQDKGKKAKRLAKKHDWGRTAFNKKPVEKKRQKKDKEGKPKFGPKYGYMLVRQQIIEKYDFTKVFDIGKKYQAPALDTDYTPSVYRATREDIETYNNSEEKEAISFHEFIEQNNLADKRQVRSIWVRNEDLTGLTLEKGNYRGVDFSGCILTFPGRPTKLKECDFSHANFSFIEAQYLICEDVNFVHANFSSADLRDVTFKNIQDKCAIWIDTQVDGLTDNKKNTDIQKEIEALKATQATALQKMTSELQRVSKEQTKHLKTLYKNASKANKVDIQNWTNQARLNAYSQHELERLTRENETITVAIKNVDEASSQQMVILKETKREQAEKINRMNKHIRKTDERISYIGGKVKGLDRRLSTLEKTVKTEIASLPEKIHSELESHKIKYGPKCRSEKEIISIIKNHSIDTFKDDFILQQALKYYVPLDGSLAPLSGSEEKKEKMRKILHEERTLPFLTNKTQKQPLMLLLGESGAGKSTYAHHLNNLCWEDLASGKLNIHRIPILIECKSIKPEQLKLDYLTYVFKNYYGLNELEILALKKLPLLFIFDGYDEKHIKNFNVYDTLNLAHWNAKVLVTCRTQYVQALDNYKSFFSVNENTCTEIYVCPFSKSQINGYITDRYKSADKSTDILKALEENIALKELIENPLLLRMVAEVLPKLLKDENNKALYKNKHPNVMHIQKFTRADVYKAFIHDWFEREAYKLTKRTGKTEIRLWNFTTESQITFNRFCEHLATEMLLHHKVEIYYKATDSTGAWWEKEVKAANEWDKFFKNTDKSKNQDLIDIRSGCPLRCVNNTYSFYHKSFLEYFAASQINTELFSEDALKIEDINLVNHIVG